MHYVKNFLLLIIFIRAAKDAVLANLTQARDAMLLAAEFVTELKVMRAALHTLVASDGKSAAASE